MAANDFQLLTTRTEPLSEYAAKLVDRLDLRLNAPDVLPAAARYSLASRRTAEISRWIGPYNVTDMHMNDLEYAQDTMRECRAILAAAGRLDLIGGA